MQAAVFLFKKILANSSYFFTLPKIHSQKNKRKKVTDFRSLEQTFEFDVYKKFDVTLIRGKNAFLWDDRGKKYIDCVSGNGVSNLGHGNEAVVRAIAEQAKTLITCSNVFYNDKRALLLEKLIQITPENLSRAFLCNSGTESIEAAIKFARYSTGRSDFICAEKAFHGRTFAAMSATYKPEYKEVYEPLLPGFSFVPFNDFEKLAEVFTDKTAGVILEVVQGEGGIHVATADFLAQTKQYCEQHGALLIIDEIQSGFCRTGKMFAGDHFDLQPDILCLAKGIAGGLPMGATVCSDKVKIPLGRHGTTFGGNPLSCAAALANIRFMLDHHLDDAAREKGDYFMQRMQSKTLAKVAQIRHLGLMIGIEVHGEARPLILELKERGLLTFAAGTNVIRVFPPLTIEYADLDHAIDTLLDVLQ